MFTGKAYSRAIRGHILASSALTSMLLEEFWSDLNDEEKSLYETLYDSDPLENENHKLADKLCSWYAQKKAELTSSSRTAALWLNYIQYIHIVQAFIRAERTSNWPLHTAATKSMLNLFAATGHNNYAKTCRIYLQSMEEMEKQHPLLLEQFLLGNHTVKRSEKKWAGIWTDLSIEQILMKSLKGRGGIIGRGMSENVARVWTKTMHRCAEVSRAMDKLCFPADHTDNHKELDEGRIQRDNEHFNKIKEWFKAHNPFTCGEKLISLGSGKQLIYFPIIN